MLIQKMIRAARLDVHLYEEVETDTKATPEAMLVVILSSLSAGIGLGIKGGLRGLLVGIVASLVGWFIWALITCVIGTTLFKGPQTKSNVGELLRTLGFSASPGVIRILGFIPGMSHLVFLVAGIWSLIAMVVAVRQALDFTTARAIGTCIVGWIIQAIILGLILGPAGRCPL